MSWYVEVNANGTALRGARSRKMISRLLDAGAAPADADQRVILGLQATGDEGLAEVSPDDFRQAFSFMTAVALAALPLLELACTLHSGMATFSSGGVPGAVR